MTTAHLPSHQRGGPRPLARAVSLCFHDVIETRQGQSHKLPPSRFRYALDRDQFGAHLDAIAGRVSRASVCAVNDLPAGCATVPVLLTFDDGAEGAITCVADDLEGYGWRGHFFIVTNWLGRSGYLTPAHIRELDARGHVIGSHSCSHPERMSQLSWPELLSEWRDSRTILSDVIGKNVNVASVPNGYSSAAVARAAAAAGIETLFTSDPGVRTTIVDGCLVVGRYMIQRQTPAALSAAYAGSAPLAHWRYAAWWEAKRALKGLLGERYLTMRRLLLSRRLHLT